MDHHRSKESLRGACTLCQGGETALASRPGPEMLTADKHESGRCREGDRQRNDNFHKQVPLCNQVNRNAMG